MRRCSVVTSASARRQLGDDCAVFHNVDAVCELQHLVEPMGHENERRARLERPHSRKQDVDLGALKHRGGFVEQNHEMASRVLFECQRLGELDHLARSEAEVVSAHARIDVDFDLFELPRRGRIEVSPTDESEARELRLIAEIDVFADCEIGEQGLFLKHHADAFSVGVGGVFETRRLSRDKNLSRVRADRRHSGSS